MGTKLLKWSTKLGFSLGVVLSSLPVLGHHGAHYPDGSRVEDRVVRFHEHRTSRRPDDAGAWRHLARALVRRAEVTGDVLAAGA